MFAQSLCVLLAAGVISASPARQGPFAGVDPNSLSCDPAGQVHLLLPHFTDCARYFQCVHGREVDMPCAAGTIFDFELQVCNWPSATQCWLRGQEIDGSGDGDDGVWDAQENSEAVQIQPASFRADLDCSDARSASKSLPYRGDCQRFLRCSNGKVESAYCSDGLFFNAQSQMCDFEANAKCQVEVEDELQGEFIVYK